MKWLGYLLVLVFALSVQCAALAQSSGEERLAEYKTPEIGTQLRYAGWSCNVEEAEGLRTLCRLDDGSAVTLVGWMEIDGNLPDTGYFGERLYFYLAGAQKVYTLRAGLSESDLTKIEALWPLKVGNKSRYRVRVHAGLQFDVRASVDSIEMLDVGGEKIETFVIALDSRLRGDSQRQDFQRHLWYAPSLGVVVKEEFEWTQGSRRGQRFDSALLSAQLPDGTPTFAFTPRPDGDETRQD